VKKAMNNTITARRNVRIPTIFSVIEKGAIIARDVLTAMEEEVDVLTEYSRCESSTHSLAIVKYLATFSRLIVQHIAGSDAPPGKPWQNPGLRATQASISAGEFRPRHWLKPFPRSETTSKGEKSFL
jgi:hypothetical protein